jgi:integrase
MNDAQIKSKLKVGKPGKFNIERGLYFRVSKEGTGFWILRYTINNKRREFSFGRYGRPPEGTPLFEARLEAARLRSEIKNGFDPLAEKHRSILPNLNTVDDIAADWLIGCRKRLENPQIPERVYRKDIQPKLGGMSIGRVNARDILELVREINNSRRPSIANDALSYCKQIFNHSVKLGLINNNPALALTIADAGGVEKPRNRALSFQELQITLGVLDARSDIFTRENYIAFVLLVALGVRKGELIAAKWSEFDLGIKCWNLPAERTKTRVTIKIPLPERLLPLINELLVRSNGSEYLFPSRRSSKRRGYISDDTLNHALAKMFGKKVDSKKQPYPNLLGGAGIDYFVVHDLRRTCRSLLAEIGTPPHIAERCLNHKLRGVEGIYDRYDYFEERKQALTDLAERVLAQT